MANNYYDATGVLVLDKVTPVITALFGGFKLDKTYPGNGEAYIAKISEDNAASWDDVLQGFRGLVSELGLSFPKDAEGTIEEYLYLLASHFGAENDDVLANLIEHNDFEDCADLGTLFDIAKRLDDGHGLKVLKVEGCWYCSKPRLFEFGGEGYYFGRHCSIDTASSWALTFGGDLDAALEARDVDKSANLIAREIERILLGVLNDESRDALRERAGNLLLSKVAKTSKPKWYAITGCIPGEDEDSCQIFQAANRDEALAAFEDAMWKSETKAKRENVWREHGQYVFVTSIVASDSPITYPA